MMENPIVEKIVQEGLHSVKLAMLDEKSRKEILSDAAEKLFKKQKYIECIEIMKAAGEVDNLIKLGDLFFQERRFEFAALCYIPTKNKEKLNEAAVHCIKIKNYKLAAEAYDAAENKQMATFIRENFC